jgi:hypothetical protein
MQRCVMTRLISPVRFTARQLLVASIGVSLGCPSGVVDGADGGTTAEGEGEGIAEGELEPLPIEWLVDGASIGAGPLDLGEHDPVGGAQMTALSLRNVGTESFSILSQPPMLLAGPDASLFSVTNQPASTDVAPDTAIDFVLSYAPLSGGPHQAHLLFAWGVRATQRTKLDITGSTPGGGGDGEAQLRYAIYDGSFTQLPDFAGLTPVETGLIDQFSIAARQNDDAYAYVFEGLIEVGAEGNYTFFTTSDDGSRLRVNGAEVVANDGQHGQLERSGTVSLAPGRHPIRVEYFEAGGDAVLRVEWQGPGINRQEIPAAVLFH